ncbi:hypothetical protein BpHYR1_028806 [Brachionus plicatilis]|uniref:Uncharacterized protein n=1 Tax=Brachionus plicatilis TaxID=10195 RepID=A0A3M7P8W1_BRAPC|nr:hypothetical protein BpHYR1_028806 [Brachionus plicatilis]
MYKTNTHQDCEKTTPGDIDPEKSENKIRFFLSELILLNVYNTSIMIQIKVLRIIFKTGPWNLLENYLS